MNRVYFDWRNLKTFRSIAWLMNTCTFNDWIHWPFKMSRPINSYFYTLSLCLFKCIINLKRSHEISQRISLQRENYKKALL